MRNPFFDLKLFAVTLALAISAIAVCLHLSRRRPRCAVLAGICSFRPDFWVAASAAR